MSGPGPGTQEMFPRWEQLVPLLSRVDNSVTRWALVVGQMELGRDPCFGGMWGHLTLPHHPITRTSLIPMASLTLAEVPSLAGKKSGFKPSPCQLCDFGPEPSLLSVLVWASKMGIQLNEMTTVKYPAHCCHLILAGSSALLPGS